MFLLPKIVIRPVLILYPIFLNFLLAVHAINLSYSKTFIWATDYATESLVA